MIQPDSAKPKAAQRMRILVTGGAGFIGSRLCVALARRGHEVTALDNLSPQIHGQDFTARRARANLSGCRFIQGDVLDRAVVRKAVKSQQAIVHLAAETGTGQSMYQIAKYSEVNVCGTAIVLEAVAESARDLGKFVLASSRAVYGEGAYRCGRHGTFYPGSRSEQALAAGRFELPCPQCGRVARLVATREDAAIQPISVYGATKFQQEQTVSVVCASLGLPSVALRFQNVYGPGQSLANPYTGILSIFSRLLLAGKDLNIFEDGRESRDFVYVDDVISAVISATEAKSSGHEVYNVGTGRAVSVQRIAELLRKAYGTGGEIRISGQYRTGDIRHNFADISKIRRALGFTPTVRLEQGLERFAAWARTQEAGPDRFGRSLLELKKRGLLK